jgi:thiol-disulfide isomerase/thioredoxin
MAMRVIRGRFAARCACLVAIAWAGGSMLAADKPDAGAAEPAAAASKTHTARKPIANPFPTRHKLPDEAFDGGKEWLNASGPIELRDLRGKIVLVDFWTYCCINCMHILPDLKYLEHKYPNELIVIGCHSAKFENEKESENIRRAILRYDIEHPVVNDADMHIWRRFHVNSWPTVAVIDPDGKLIGSVSGEGHRDVLDQVVQRLIAYHKSNGTLDSTPLKLGLERHNQPSLPLKFPGKIIADETGDRLFIADSNHNRIVVCTLEGKLLDVAGSGEIGQTDGSFATATFHHPQGMALNGTVLYVADTENHLIRGLDLQNHTVTTLAGTGQQAAGREAGGKLRQTPLNSPWDLLIVNRTLYVAMAGAHQIWSHVLGSETIEAVAGSGREDVLNGPPSEAAFAQPSGLTTDRENLYVADSEGSAIRKLPFAGEHTVSTIAGTSGLDSGQSLFAFGDVDGLGARARLQHPLGLTYNEGSLFVADTYNHKIKSIDLRSHEVRTFLGTGKRGDALNPPEFSEPGGLCTAKGKLFIADTNNHAIKVADLGTREVRVLTIDGLKPPASANRSEPAGDEHETAEAPSIPQLAVQRIAAGTPLRLEIAFKLPAGYKLNKAAPATVRLQAPAGTPLFAPKELAKRRRAIIKNDKAHVTIPMAHKSGSTVLEASLTFTYCRDGVGGVCKLATARWKVPIDVAADAPHTVVVLSADVGG